MSEKVVIAGAGHAAGQVVATLKQKNFGGNIVLLGDEPYLPYQRPPLSKKFLAGELDAERLYFKPPAFYDDAMIEVRLRTRVSSINPGAHTITTHDGESIAYDKLVLALGSRARRIPSARERLSGVFYLRGIDDVNKIRSEIAAEKRVAIVGAGYIGLEVAAVCRQLSLQVTVVELAERVMSRVVSPQVSAFYQRQHENHGVRFLLSTGLSALHGDQHVTALELDDGRVLETDLVIVGAGILPNCELAQDAGLQIENGIAVDESCLSSDPDIYAVGDCTSHYSHIYGRRIRLESVHNALEQAKTAAGNICGLTGEYSQLPWFWSDQYDLKLQIAGLSEGYDEVVIRGDENDKKFACFYLRDGVLIAVDAINSPRDFMRSKPLIAARTVIDPAKLTDPE